MKHELGSDFDQDGRELFADESARKAGSNHILASGREVPEDEEEVRLVSVDGMVLPARNVQTLGGMTYDKIMRAVEKVTSKG